MNIIKFKSGKQLVCKIVEKTLNTLVVRATDGQWLLVSRYAIQNAEEFWQKE